MLGECTEPSKEGTVSCFGVEPRALLRTCPEERLGRLEVRSRTPEGGHVIFLC